MFLFDKYRNDFGIFRTNPEIAYFDYATTTFMPEQVINAYLQYVNTIGVSVDRGSTYLHQQAKDVYNKAVDNITNFFIGTDAVSKYRMIFGKNTTELINIISYSIEDQIQPLDFIVVGPYEHHSNYLPWKYLAERKGALFVELPVNLEGEIDYSYLKKIAPSIKLISLSAVSNTNGYKIDIDKVISYVSSDTFVMIDAAQLVAHDRINTNEKISCIFLSSHKMYGPKNIAGALVKKSLIPLLKPVFFGGGMVETIGISETWQKDEDKFLAGTIDASLLMAWSSACDYIKDIGFDAISQKEKYLYNKIRNALESINNITIIGPSVPCASSLISFVHKTIHAHDIQEYFSENNIIVRAGNLCSQNSLVKYGLNAITRISFGIGITDKCLNKILKTLTCLGRKTNNYSGRPNKKIILPDEILTRDGIACGDTVNLMGEVNKGTLEFIIHVNGCSHAIDAAKALEARYNNCNIQHVIEDCENYYKSLILLERNCARNEATPKKCMLQVVRTFLEFVKNLSDIHIETHEMTETKKTLACDACVSISRINWGNNKTIKVKSFSRTESKLCEMRKAQWMRCGKLYLSPSEVNLLTDLVKDMTNEDFDYLWRNKLDQIIFNHIKHYKLYSKDIRWKKTIFECHRKNVISYEAKYIKYFIETNHILASYIKGAINENLYTDEYERVFMDYDILAGSAEDAFKIANFLFSRGFHILFDVFSLKEVDINGENKITGHFHLKKFIDYKYQLIVDISFPAYPLGRIGLFYPKFVCGNLSQEEQFIITLCHVFKHEVVFMKDINDLYLMVKQEKLNYNVLNKLLIENNLIFFFSIVMSFILNNYDINDELKTNIRKFIGQSEYAAEIDNFKFWPFDQKYVYKVKEADYKRRLFNCVDKKRMYLFPLVIFNTLCKIEITSLEKMTEDGFVLFPLCEGICILQINRLKLILTSMGLFIDNSSDISNIGRERIRNCVAKILNTCGIIEFLEIPYLIDDWHY